MCSFIFSYHTVDFSFGFLGTLEIHLLKVFILILYLTTEMQLDLIISFITKHFKNHPEPISQQMEADYQLLITNKK